MNSFFTQTITQQSSRPFVMKLDHFAHGILMGYNLNKPILVWQYRFNICQWTASHLTEGGVRVCGIAVLGYFWCGVAVIFISKYGIAVFRVQAVCGEFEFYVAVVGEKIVVSRWSASFSWQEDTNPKRSGAPNDNFRKNICSEDDLRSRIFGTFVVKFLACLLLLGFSNI